MLNYLIKQIENGKEALFSIEPFSSSNFLNEIKRLKDTGLTQENRTKIINLWKLILGKAINYLKKHDDREKVHDETDFGVDTLTNYFKQFHTFEKILYGVSPYYRDHSFHVFRVFLLGFYIIHRCTEFKSLFIFDFNSLDDDIKETCRIEPGELEAMWALTALTHDLGYPLEKLGEINKSIREMIDYFGKANLQEFSFNFPSHFHFINDFILRFVSSSLILKRDAPAPNLFTHIQSKYYLKFSKAFEDYNHGIISCIILMKNLTYFLESDYLLDSYKPLAALDAKNYLIRREILRSIASHSCEEIYHFKIKTMGFFLLICDELQEWSRHTVQKKSGAIVEAPWNVTIKHFDAEKGEIEFLIEIIEEQNLSFKSFIERYALLYYKRSKKFYKVLRCAVVELGREIKKFRFVLLKPKTNKESNDQFYFCFDYRIVKVVNNAGKEKVVKEKVDVKFRIRGKGDGDEETREEILKRDEFNEEDIVKNIKKRFNYPIND